MPFRQRVGLFENGAWITESLSHFRTVALFENEHVIREYLTCIRHVAEFANSCMFLDNTVVVGALVRQFRTRTVYYQISILIMYNYNRNYYRHTNTPIAMDELIVMLIIFIISLLVLKRLFWCCWESSSVWRTKMMELVQYHWWQGIEQFPDYQSRLARPLFWWEVTRLNSTRIEWKKSSLNTHIVYLNHIDYY